MTTACVRLPYFDRILEVLQADDPDVALAFGRHVHWGYWDDPTRADGSVQDFAQAGERLSQCVAAAAGIGDGQRILDVGCGFGGTLANLDDRFSGMDLVGVTIDARQLKRAQRLTQPRSSNGLRFVEADACQLPFAERSFDAVLATESIFHFPGRDRFFNEVQRVLRPGGKLALCAFVPRFVVPIVWDYFDRRVKPIVTRLYGRTDMRCTLADYRRLARDAGLKLVLKQDITRNTWPTFRLLRPLVRHIAANQDKAEQVIARVQFTTWIGLLRYLVLAFALPPSMNSTR